MRQLRITVTAIVSLLVAFATVGSLSVASHPHETGRRRGHAVRVTRVGAQRLDHAEGISHELEHHDPVVSLAADGLTGARRNQVAAPPGHRRVHRAAHSVPGAVTLSDTSDRVLPHPNASALAPEPTFVLARSHYRLALGRAPPHAI